MALRDFSRSYNHYFPTEEMTRAIVEALPELITSHASVQPILNEKLSSFIGCHHTHLQLLHGASQIFPILRKLFENLPAAIPSPTFAEYNRIFPNSITYPDELEMHLENLGYISEETAAIVVINPNTPTGTILPTAELYSFIRRNPNISFIIDETYLPFSGEQSLISLLENSPVLNVLVLSSLSSSCGIPGLRLGYAYSLDSTLIAAIGNELPPDNISAIAEYFLELLTNYKSEYEESVSKVIAERERMRSELINLPIVNTVYQSGANFLLVLLDHSEGSAADWLKQRLLVDHEIMVNDVTTCFPDALPRLQIGVKRREDNQSLLAALSHYRELQY